MLPRRRQGSLLRRECERKGCKIWRSAGFGLLPRLVLYLCESPRMQHHPRCTEALQLLRIRYLQINRPHAAAGAARAECALAPTHWRGPPPTHWRSHGTQPATRMRPPADPPPTRGRWGRRAPPARACRGRCLQGAVLPRCTQELWTQRRAAAGQCKVVSCTAGSWREDSSGSPK